jgi:hypothetical protein
LAATRPIHRSHSTSGSPQRTPDLVADPTGGGLGGGGSSGSMRGRARGWPEPAPVPGLGSSRAGGAHPDMEVAHRSRCKVRHRQVDVHAPLGARQPVHGHARDLVATIAAGMRATGPGASWSLRPGR